MLMQGENQCWTVICGASASAFDPQPQRLGGISLDSSIHWNGVVCVTLMLCWFGMLLILMLSKAWRGTKIILAQWQVNTYVVPHVATSAYKISIFIYNKKLPRKYQFLSIVHTILVEPWRDWSHLCFLRIKISALTSSCWWRNIWSQPSFYSTDTDKLFVNLPPCLVAASTFIIIIIIIITNQANASAKAKKNTFLGHNE